MTHQPGIVPTAVAHPSALDALDALDALGATHVAPPAMTTRDAFTAPLASAKTTVLPHVGGSGQAIQLSLESRSRYEPTKLLGAGGMGEVVLVKDHDIERRVALKRLPPEMTDPAVLARFVDEIRCVGRLEHPNIVPIHDVGVDELGRYYFVMKYVEGETLESIIEKLAAGDPAYTRKYPLEARVELFLGLLNALAYAHEKGIVHRDIKPANIMIGRFGEVVLMDWGIAKPLDATRDAARGPDGSIDVSDGDGERKRMYATRIGSLIGTPAYMSPEQARGDVDKIDVRSDLYSAIVVLHELLGLRHYLAEKQTMDQLLAGVMADEFTLFKIFGVGMTYPFDAPPIDWSYVIAQGLEKDPAKRFQSASELITTVHALLAGKVPVVCPITGTKRAYRELGKTMDRSPMIGMFVMMMIVAACIFSGVQLVRMALS